MTFRTILFSIAAAMTMPSAYAAGQAVEISRSHDRGRQPAPADHFTGTVTVEALFGAIEPSHVSGGAVTFEAGARTAWHTHPRGQILIVTAGIRAGDVVRIPAGQKHWHGAAPDTAMAHVAITEHRDGVRVNWMEPVTDEQYQATPGARR
jgi:4-carboxymuconolactone decarboxylase